MGDVNDLDDPTADAVEGAETVAEAEGEKEEVSLARAGSSQSEVKVPKINFSHVHEEYEVSNFFASLYV